MDVKKGNLYPNTIRSDLATALNDAHFIMHKSVTQSPSYGTVLAHKSARRELDAVTALHERVQDVAPVHKTHESRASGTEIVKNKNRALEWSSVIQPKSWDP